MTTYTVIQLTEGMPVAQLNEFAQRVEGLGYDGLWVPELDGREPVALSAHLLANTSTLNIGIGSQRLRARLRRRRSGASDTGGTFRKAGALGRGGGGAGDG